MDVNQIVNGIGAGIAGALTMWLMSILHKERKRNGKNK